jgi:hypothetical protein
LLDPSDPRQFQGWKQGSPNKKTFKPAGQGDVGLVFLRGHVTPGYFHNPAETERALLQVSSTLETSAGSTLRDAFFSRATEGGVKSGDHPAGGPGDCGAPFKTTRGGFPIACGRPPAKTQT